MNQLASKFVSCIARTLHPLVVAAPVIVAAGHFPPAAAANYAFTKIADANSMPFTRFGGSSISRNGTVAFYASHITDGAGVYTGNGGPVATIADASGPFKDFVGFPTINAAGTVAFHAVLDNDEHGIYTGNGGSVTTIADVSGTLNSFSVGGSDSSPAINDSGAVAFRAGLDAGGEGIFVGSGGSLTTIADSNGPFANFELLPDLNAAGTAVFAAELDAGGRGVFTGNGGPTATIADSSGPYNLLLGPAINDSGDVAFATVFDNHFMPNIHFGVVKGSGGATTTVADLTFPPFSNIRPPVSINADGTVLFRGDLNNTNPATQGIFTGPDSVDDKVIAFGDPLFGATVRSLGFVYRSLSDHGDVAFNYELSTGELGVAVARLVPEPSAIVLAIGWLGMWTPRYRRPRRANETA
jgi:hypothetical protein